MSTTASVLQHPGNTQPPIGRNIGLVPRSRIVRDFVLLVTVCLSVGLGVGLGVMVAVLALL